MSPWMACSVRITLILLGISVWALSQFGLWHVTAYSGAAPDVGAGAPAAPKPTASKKANASIRISLLLSNDGQFLRKTHPLHFIFEVDFIQLGFDKLHVLWPALGNEN